MPRARKTHQWRESNSMSPHAYFSTGTRRSSKLASDKNVNCLFQIMCSYYRNAHAESRTRVTSMGGLYDTATLHALIVLTDVARYLSKGAQPESAEAEQLRALVSQTCSVNCGTGAGEHTCCQISQRPRGHWEVAQLRMPGVEPGSQAWEACMIPLHYMR